MEAEEEDKSNIGFQYLYNVIGKYWASVNISETDLLLLPGIALSLLLGLGLLPVHHRA